MSFSSQVIECILMLTLGILGVEHEILWLSLYGIPQCNYRRENTIVQYALIKYLPPFPLVVYAVLQMNPPAKRHLYKYMSLLLRYSLLTKWHEPLSRK